MTPQQQAARDRAVTSLREMVLAFSSPLLREEREWIDSAVDTLIADLTAATPGYESARRGEIAERFQSYISTARNARRQYEKGAAEREGAESVRYLDYAHGESVKEQILRQAHAALDYDLFESAAATPGQSADTDACEGCETRFADCQRVWKDQRVCCPDCCHRHVKALATAPANPRRHVEMQKAAGAILFGDGRDPAVVAAERERGRSR